MRCSKCQWITYFAVDVIHEVKDEATWTCSVCNTESWDGFAVEPDPFPNKPKP